MITTINDDYKQNFFSKYNKNNINKLLEKLIADKKMNVKQSTIYDVFDTTDIKKLSDYMLSLNRSVSLAETFRANIHHATTNLKDLLGSAFLDSLDMHHFASSDLSLNDFEIISKIDHKFFPVLWFYNKKISKYSDEDIAELFKKCYFHVIDEDDMLVYISIFFNAQNKIDSHQITKKEWLYLLEINFNVYNTITFPYFYKNNSDSFINKLRVLHQMKNAEKKYKISYPGDVLFIITH